MRRTISLAPHCNHSCVYSPVNICPLQWQSVIVIPCVILLCLVGAENPASDAGVRAAGDAQPAAFTTDRATVGAAGPFDGAHGYEVLACALDLGGGSLSVQNNGVVVRS